MSVLYMTVYLRGECICHNNGFYSNELGRCTTNCDTSLGQVPDKYNFNGNEYEWRCLKCLNGAVVNHMCTCPSQLSKLNLDGDECQCTNGTASFNGACIRIIFKIGLSRATKLSHIIYYMSSLNSGRPSFFWK